MAQRLVLKATTGEVSLGELQDFLRRAKEYGMTTTTMAEGECSLSVPLPEKSRVVNGKKVKLAPKTAKEKRVKEQIQTHQEAKATSKQPVAYVPPEGRTTPPPIKKEKCPVCNVRKPLTKVGRLTVIKPHLSKGEECKGSGSQVVAKKKSASKKPAKKTAKKTPRAKEKK